MDETGLKMLILYSSHSNDAWHLDKKNNNNKPCFSRLLAINSKSLFLVYSEKSSTRWPSRYVAIISFFYSALSECVCARARVLKHTHRGET